MAPTKVALIGAGIGGPVLAMLLKQKGYEPVLYERLEKVTSAGLSLVYDFYPFPSSYYCPHVIFVILAEFSRTA